jgi:membrane protein DedA with SNARE-associated domain
MLSAVWGILTLGLSVMLTQELGALVGGFAAEQGHFRFVTVVTVAAVAVFAESAGLYWMGRWRAAWVRLRLRKSPPVVKKLLAVMRWNPWRSTFVSRFAFGARVALPLACGAARVPSWIFLTGTAVASVVWALVFVSLGWVFGEGAVLLVGEVRRYESVVAVALVLIVACVFWWLKRREQRARQHDLASRDS